MKHIVSRMSSYFPNRWPLSYLNLMKNMKTYIRRQQHKKPSNTKTYEGCSLILVIDSFSPKPSFIPEENYLPVEEWFFVILKSPNYFKMIQLIMAN